MRCPRKPRKSSPGNRNNLFPKKNLAISFSWPKRNELHNASYVEHIQSLSELQHEETLIPSMLERWCLSELQQTKP
jgi:hypothetical protein